MVKIAPDVARIVLQVGIMHDADLAGGMSQRRAQRCSFSQVAFLPQQQHPVVFSCNPLQYSPAPIVTAVVYHDHF